MTPKAEGTAPLYEQVARQILQKITDGVYQKGDLLPSEKELIAMTGVSRITVRGALKDLADMGVIETRKGKGSFVIVDADAFSGSADEKSRREQHRTDFINSTRARLLIEPEVARSAAIHASDAEIARLEAALSKQISRKNPEEQFDEFHRVLAQAAHNPLILSFLESLLQMEARLEKASQGDTMLVVPEKQRHTSSELQRQHRRIFEAVQDHDGEFAYFYMKEHMLYLLRSYEEYFSSFQ